MGKDDGDVKDDRAETAGKRLSLDELIGFGEPVQVEPHKKPPDDRDTAWAISRGHVRNRLKKNRRKAKDREAFGRLPSIKTALRSKRPKGTKDKDTQISNEMLSYGLLAGVTAVGLALFMGRR